MEMNFQRTLNKRNLYYFDTERRQENRELQHQKEEKEESLL